MSAGDAACQGEAYFGGTEDCDWHGANLVDAEECVRSAAFLLICPSRFGLSVCQPGGHFPARQIFTRPRAPGSPYSLPLRQHKTAPV